MWWLVLLAGCEVPEVDGTDTGLPVDTGTPPVETHPMDAHPVLPPVPLVVVAPEVPVDLSGCGGAAVTHASQPGIPVEITNPGSEPRSVRGVTEWQDDGTVTLYLGGEEEVPAGGTRWLDVDVMLLCAAGPGTYAPELRLATDGPRGPLEQAVPIVVVAE